MTMTDERLAELRATMTHAKATDYAPGVAWGTYIMRFDDVLAALDQIDAQAATIARLQEAHETVCEIWGNQERGDLYLDWEDAADDMHNTSVAALTGAAS